VQISQVLRRKGRNVATVDGAESVRTALEQLARLGVGALVVSADGKHIDGIVSERDVARGLHERGAELLSDPVSSLMTADVHTCRPDSRLDELETERAQLVDYIQTS
jgi:CBS domain-containing protein